jgi:hypothetical protein
MAHIHLIDKRFRIYRVTDTRPYRHMWAGLGCSWLSRYAPCRLLPGIGT